MPTMKPRVSITLDPSVLEAVDRFCEVFGEKRATVLADLIQTAVPQMNRAAHLMEIAKASPDRMKARFRDDLARATSDVLGDMEGANQALDAFLEQMQGELDLDLRRGGAKAREGTASPRRRTRSADPHLLTGGSK